MTTFTYKITSIDEQNKVLTVEFNDGSWAEIRLECPLPTTMEDVGAIVAQYTYHMEHQEAKEQPADSIAFIKDHLGKELTAERQWMTDPADKVEDNPDLTQYVDDLANRLVGQNATEDQIKAATALGELLELYQDSLYLKDAQLQVAMTRDSQYALDSFFSQLVIEVKKAYSVSINGGTYERPEIAVPEPVFLEP